MRTGLALGELDLEHLFYEPRIADAVAVAQQGGRDLGIKYPQWKRFCLAEKNLHVLLPGMNDHLDLRIAKQFNQHAAIHPLGEGIHRNSLSLQPDLDEAQFGPVGIFPEKLGVESERTVFPATLQQVFE